MGITTLRMRSCQSRHIQCAPTAMEILTCWYLVQVILTLEVGTYACIAGPGQAPCGGAIVPLCLQPSLYTMGHCIEATSTFQDPLQLNRDNPNPKPYTLFLGAMEVGTFSADPPYMLYIYILCVSLSLYHSLSIYIYIYTHIHKYIEIEGYISQHSEHAVNML